MSIFASRRRRATQDRDPARSAAALRSAGVFAGAPQASLERLAEATDAIEVPPGTDVLPEGRIPAYFYVVGSGLLEVLSTGEGDHEPVQVNTIQEGGHFGEIGLLEGMPATATVRSKTDCVLYRIPAREFLAAVGASPALASTLLERVAGGLARTHPSYAPVGTAATDDAVLRDVARIAGVVGPALRPPGEDELLKAIVATAMNIFEAAACSIALLLPDGSLEFRAAAGAGGDQVEGLVVPPGAGIAGAVVESGRPLVIEDVERDERFAAAFAGATGYKPRSIAARPLDSSYGVVGVIEVLDAPGFLSDPDASLPKLDLFARLAALAIHNGRLFSDFGRSLLAAAAEAATGTDLADALDRAAGRAGADPSLFRMGAVVQRLMTLDPAERESAIDSIRDRLAGEARPGS